MSQEEENRPEKLRGHIQKLKAELAGIYAEREHYMNIALEEMRKCSALRDLARELWRYLPDWSEHFASLAEFEAFEARAKALNVVPESALAVRDRLGMKTREGELP